MLVTGHRVGGFTLLELLVALAVLGFIIVGLSQGVRFGLLAWDSSVRIAGVADEIGPVDNALRYVIEGIDAGDDLDPARLVGSANSVDCTTWLPGAAGPLPQRHVEVALLVDANHRLVLRWRPFMDAEHRGSSPPLREIALLDGVSRIEFSYWRGDGWSNAWHSPSLPRLVRIRLQFPSGDPRHWPDIVTAPLLDRR